jgi:NodT family efflux transporter outer membrane factor (OMF) lipoprotein
MRVMRVAAHFHAAKGTGMSGLGKTRWSTLAALAAALLASGCTSRRRVGSAHHRFSRRWAQPTLLTRWSTLAALAAALVTTGCTSFRDYVHNGFKVGPNYCKPAAPVADEWIDSLNPRLVTGPMETAAWWHVFGDPALDRLINIAYEQNITLREAGFRIAESQARRAVTVGNLFPQTQEAFGDYQHIQRSTVTATFPRGAVLPPGLIITNFDNLRLGGTLAWELDFWGRYRRAIESADANLDASVEGYDDALVLLISEVATAYVDFRTLEQRLAYARANVALQSESARIANVRLEAGRTDAEVDAPQANSNLARTQAAIELLEIAKRQSQNRLAVLLGMPPHDLSYLLADTQGIPRAPETIAVDIPASLLRRRPDVRQAERLVAAQSALIGVAQANLYPAISINGTGNLEAGRLADLFRGEAFAGTVGPAFRWNVLNYGRLINAIRIEDALLQQRIAAYQQTVLQANEEAENAIVGYLRYHNSIDFLQTSVLNAKEAVRVTQAKYDAGNIDFNRVFTVETLLVSQQDELASNQGNSALSVIELYRAMGGGWQIRLGEPPVAPLPAVAPAPPAPGENVPAPAPMPLPPQPVQP